MYWTSVCAPKWLVHNSSGLHFRFSLTENEMINPLPFGSPPPPHPAGADAKRAGVGARAAGQRSGQRGARLRERHGRVGPGGRPRDHLQLGGPAVPRRPGRRPDPRTHAAGTARRHQQRDQVRRAFRACVCH